MKKIKKIKINIIMPEFHDSRTNETIVRSHRDTLILIIDSQIIMPIVRALYSVYYITK